MNELTVTLDRARESGRLEASDLPVSMLYFPEWWNPTAHEDAVLTEYREGLRVFDILPRGVDPDRVTIVVNHKPDQGSGDPYRLLDPGDSVVVINVPAYTITGYVVVDLILTVAINAGIGYLVGKVLAPSGNDERDPNNSTSVYGFSGIRTNYNAAGLPVPLHYGGPIRFGGLVISETVKIVEGDPPDSFLKLIILLAAGPIEEIGGYTAEVDGLSGDTLPVGMKINGNEARNFSDVTVHLRLGTKGQSIGPGFDEIETFYFVGLPFSNTLSTSPDPIVTDYSLAAVYDFPQGAKFEKVRLGVRFPNGLYTTSSGSVNPRTVDVQVRYIELDSLGSPVGSYVEVDWTTDPNGTGNTLSISAAQTNSFTKHLEFPIIDPDLFVAPVLSNAVKFGNSTAEYGRQTLPLDVDFVAGTVFESFTFHAVLKIDTSRTVNPIFCYADVNGADANSITSMQGFVIDAPGFGATANPRLSWGSGGAPASFLSGIDIADGQYHSITVSWEKDGFSPGLGILAFYVDGQLEGTFNPLGSPLPTVPSVATYAFWRTVEGFETTFDLDNNFGDFTLDDVRFYRRALDQSEVVNLYNGGVFVEGPIDEPDLVFASHCNDAPIFPASFHNYIPFYVGSSAGIELKPDGYAPTIVTGGTFEAFDTPTRKIRLRVEVQRVTKVSVGLGTKDDTEFDHIIGIVEKGVNYTGWALAYVEIRATDQLNSSRPDITFLLKGRNDLPIWDGVDAEKPTFVPGFSTDPAWQFAGLALDKKYGGGQAVGVRDFDWASFLAHANWTAAKVWDQKTRLVAIQVAYSASEAGFSGAVYKLRFTKPRPTHYVLGKAFRVTAVADSEYPTGDFTIGAIVNISTTDYEIWLDWPTGTAVPSTNPDIDAAAANAEGLRPRIACNLTFADRGLSFWDAVNTITAVGRTSPGRIGNVLTLKIEDTRQPVAVFGPSNIALETFRISASRLGESFSIGIAEINDEDLDYERNSIPRSHSSLKGGGNASSTAVRKIRTFDMRGVTSAAQARVELDLLVNFNQGDKLFVDFEGSIDSFFLMPGNVFALAFPVPWNRYGGRCEIDASPENSVLLEGEDPEDYTTWAVGARADPVVALGDAPPFGTGTVYELSAKVAAVGTGLYTLDALKWGAEGQNQVFGVWVKEGTGADFDLRIKDVSGSSYIAIFDWTAGVPVLASVSDGTMVTAVTDGTTLAQPTPAGWYFVEVGIPTPAAAVGNDRQIQIGTAATAPYPGANIKVFGAIVQEGTDSVIGGWSRAQSIPIDVPVTIEVGKSYSIAVRDDASDAIAIVAVDPGYAPTVDVTLPAGTFLRLDSLLGFVPEQGAPWVLGESALSKALFQVLSVAPGQFFRNKVTAVTYEATDYPDPDTIDVIQASSIAPPAGVSPGPGRLPNLPLEAKVLEEASRDVDDGGLRKRLYLSWRPDPVTSRLISHTNIWIENRTNGELDMVGRVDGVGSRFRVPDAYFHRGASYTAIIQDVARNGARRGLKVCRRLNFTGRVAYPVPPAPTGLSLGRAGDRITYRWGLDPEWKKNTFVELRRGGIFVGEDVFLVPAFQSEWGPTLDFSQLVASTRALSAPKLFLRTVLPNGVKGEALAVRLDPNISTPGEQVKSYAVEDNGWTAKLEPSESTPVLTRVAVRAATDFEPEAIHFDATVENVATYDHSSITLDRAREVHISNSLEGYQVHPRPVEDFVLAVDDPAFASWTVEGPTDPNDPDFGEVKVTPLVLTDDGEGGGSVTYQRFRNGRYYGKVFHFRYDIERPANGWDVVIFRNGIRMVELSPRGLDGGTL